MKFKLSPPTNQRTEVAPFAGAWIEIVQGAQPVYEKRVAPFAGAWIEITLLPLSNSSTKVAPFAGAWIEMILSSIIMVKRFLLCAEAAFYVLCCVLRRKISKMKVKHHSEVNKKQWL